MFYWKSQQKWEVAGKGLSIQLWLLSGSFKYKEPTGSQRVGLLSTEPWSKYLTMNMIFIFPFRFQRPGTSPRLNAKTKFSLKFLFSEDDMETNKDACNVGSATIRM